MPRSPWRRVAALAIVAGAVWLPFAGRGLSPDEGGLLVLARQWSPGSSLYGDYFIDRPPLLIALVAVADAAGGGEWGLRALGIVAAVLTVTLAGVIGRLAAPASRHAPVLPAATAAVLVATPLFGSTVVNGELLGLPFLVGGIAAALAGCRAGRPGTQLAWAALAGIAGAAGALVKQSLLDVFVLALVLAVTQLRARGAATVLRGLAGGLAGAVLMTAVTVWAADARGTDPGELWRAVVLFRSEAAAVIAASATSSTTLRLGGLLLALAASGAPLLVVALVRAVRCGPAPPGLDLRWPAYAVLAWETLVVLSGGSYWLHYLMGLVPGLVLLTAAFTQRRVRPERLLRTAYLLATVSAAAALAWVVVWPIDRPGAAVVDYLEAHARPGDTAVVAFGGANILEETELPSPYPDLWSLPVRVHDPDLELLTRLLAGPDRPTWLVVTGTSLRTWGVDATTADRQLDTHYEPAATTDDFTIYRRSDRP
jgi:hypothetical protein